MSTGETPRIFSIPPGVSFLSTLVDALLGDRLVPGFSDADDPLKLAEAVIYVPTRRAARELRSAFVERLGRQSAILPAIRALGEFDEEAALFDGGSVDALALAPPVAPLDRILLLAPLVQAWKSRIPAHIAARLDEEVVVPASPGDAIWLARDLAALLDEVETEEADWTMLAGLAPDDLAGWWQVTLDFLRIVTSHWPQVLQDMQCSNPAAHRNALLAAETARLLANPPAGPVIAAGSTGSIPATQRLLAAIARLPRGAVVLPGLDYALDAASWAAVGGNASASAHGHPQYGLKKLIAALGVERVDVLPVAEPSSALAARARLLSDAMRPAETTDAWASDRSLVANDLGDGGLDSVSLVEAGNEREEALAVAVALRDAVDREKIAALVTPDRNLARRVAVELRRFGIEADDSGGSFLSGGVSATLAALALETVLRPGDPVPIVGLLKHPLLTLGLERAAVRRAVETVELVALRGGTGRPDVATLGTLFEDRLARLAEETRKPFWLRRLDEPKLGEARLVLAALSAALEPLVETRGSRHVQLADMAVRSVGAVEALAREPDGGAGGLYRGETGEAFAAFLRGLVGSTTALDFDAAEWPDIFAALIATETVKPAPGGDPRVAIWGTLEARLQSVDFMVLGGLNEGTWPRIPASDRFMSRLMKGQLALEPPERRIGQAAHDFMMAAGAPEVVLTRSARAGDAPAIASRWLLRLTTCVGPEASAAMTGRGQRLIDWARSLGAAASGEFASRPQPRPPLEARPKRFSITEIETLRRDPYALYARRVLDLNRLDPLIRDPGSAERGTLFHAVLQRFTQTGPDPTSKEALDALLSIGRDAFEELRLPADVVAVWWPRFERTAVRIVDWERERAEGVALRHAEARAVATPVGTEGATLSGYADRIDLRHSDGGADIIDYKTGSTPSKRQAHTLLAPQLALEAALLARGAFGEIGPQTASDLSYVRLRPGGEVVEESILKHNGVERTAPEMAAEAWERLTRLLAFYDDAQTGYLSRALPFREGDMEGDYDHLARVLEWSAGADEAGGEAEG